MNAPVDPRLAKLQKKPVATQKPPAPSPVPPVKEPISPSVADFKKPGLVADVVAKKRLGEEIISRVNELPALPQMVSQIMKLISDDKSNASSFEKFLAQDQALTAKLLRMVNSSFFGLRNQITSIPQAIVIVGYNSLKNLVLAASTSKMLQQACPTYGFKEQGLWKHSFMCGTWAKQITLKLGMDSQYSDELFVCGLLHDIGKLVMAKYAESNSKEMIEQILACEGNVLIAERNVFGMDHAEVGSRIAQKWNFPKKLSDIIQYHHKIESSSNYHKELAIIHLTNFLLMEGRYGMYDNFPLATPFNADYCRLHLNIDTTTVENYRKEIHESAFKFDEEL